MYAKDCDLHWDICSGEFWVTNVGLSSNLFLVDVNFKTVFLNLNQLKIHWRSKSLTHLRDYGKYDVIHEKPIFVSSSINRWKTWDDEDDDGKSRRWSLGGLEPSPPFPPLLPLPPPLPFPVSVKDPNSSSEFPEHVLLLACRDDGDSAVIAGMSDAGDVTNAEQTVSSQISGSSPAVASQDVIVEYRQWRWWLVPEADDVEDWGE